MIFLIPTEQKLRQQEEVKSDDTRYVYFQKTTEHSKLR
jgi:hypothetical protein